MTENKILIWAIYDSREGNRDQLTGVLNELNTEFKIIDVSYNKYSRLPNFILQMLSGSLHINQELLSILKEPYPDLIISCGRRTAPISLKIYKCLSKKPFLVHLMIPRFTFFQNHFDLIFTPKHDKIFKKKNIFQTLGTPNNMNLLLKEGPFSSVKEDSRFITLLLGGDHSNFKLSVDNVRNILNIINYKIGSKKFLLISTSRRTNYKVIEYLDNKAKSECVSIKSIYHPNRKNNNKNPIKDFLLQSSEIIVTGDSMSMISQACSIKKPVRLYFNRKICSKKHILFCKKMIYEGYAYSIDTLGERCDKIKVLNTAKYVANKIKKEFFDKNGRTLH